MRTRVLARVIGKIYDDALRPYGVKSTQLNLLVSIALAGPVRPGELAEWFEIEKSTMSRNVARLAEQGWVRVQDHNGRSQTLTLTKAGEALLERVKPAWEQAQEQAAERIGSVAVRGLKQIRSHIP